MQSHRPGEAQRYCTQAMTAGIKGMLYPAGTKGNETPGKSGPGDNGEGG